MAGNTGKDKGEAGAGRKARLAVELRANLKRRKGRARGTQAGKASNARLAKQPD